MAEQLTPQHFLPHVQKVFRVEGGRHALTLTVVEQRRLEDHEAGVDFREPFNLIFRGPPGDVLSEGMYRLAVEDGPSFELYVMPVHTPARDRQNYQASFN
ncbi:MAG TPA: hypothetical protein VF744_05160 [Beijerinckiaceae bacterium]|jgi:hypothetical protein